MFPDFAILPQYDPNESVELKNKNKFILLLLDDEYFTLFMDWAIEEKFSDELTFLIEADTFRFNSQCKDFSTLQRLVDQHNNLNISQHGLQNYNISLRDILSNNIPLQASLAVACQFVWNDILNKGQYIHKSIVWNSMKKKILENFKIELITVIGDDHYVIYFREFLSKNSGDLRCLSCWQDVRHVISAVQLYKRNSFSNAQTTINSIDRAYSQPYDALNIFLDFIRKIHPLIIRDSCNGLTKSTAIALADIIDTTSSIRRVESVDYIYANDQAENFEKLLRIIERETFQYLQSCFDNFLQSTEYVALVSSMRLKQSKTVQDYQRRIAFLQDLSKGKQFPYSITGNVLFLNYGKSFLSYEKGDNSVQDSISKCPSNVFKSYSNDFDKDRSGLIDRQQGASATSQDNFDATNSNAVKSPPYHTSNRRRFCHDCRTNTPHTKCDIIASLAMKVSLACEPNSNIGLISHSLWVTSSSDTSYGSSCYVNSQGKDQLEGGNNCVTSYLIDSRRKYIDLNTGLFVNKANYHNNNSDETIDQNVEDRCMESYSDDDIGGYIVHLSDLCSMLTSSVTCWDQLLALSKVEALMEEGEESTSCTATNAHNITKAFIGLCDLISNGNEPKPTSTTTTATTITDDTPNYEKQRGRARTSSSVGESLYNNMGLKPTTYLASVRNISHVTSLDSSNTENEYSLVYALSSLPIIETLQLLVESINAHRIQVVDEVVRRNISISTLTTTAAVKCVKYGASVLAYLGGSDQLNGSQLLDDSVMINDGRLSNDLMVKLSPISANVIQTNCNWLRWNKGMSVSSNYALPIERVVDLYLPLSDRQLLGNANINYQGSLGTFLCDFSLCELFSVVSVQLLVEGMLLLLSNRSVVFHSLSNEYTLKVIIALQILIYPFQLVNYDITHSIATKQTFDICSANPFIKHRSGKDSFLCGIHTDVVTAIIESQRDIQSFNDKIGEAETITDELLQSENNVNKFQNYDLHEVTFIDIDREKILTAWNHNQYANDTSNLMLLCPSALKILVSKVRKCCETHKSVCRAPKTHLEIKPSCKDCLCNYNIQKLFRYYINEIVLHDIPKFIQHYPVYKVISCDIVDLKASIIEKYQMHSTLSRSSISDFVDTFIGSPSFANILIRHGISLRICDPT